MATYTADPTTPDNTAWSATLWSITGGAPYALPPSASNGDTAALGSRNLVLDQDPKVGSVTGTGSLTISIAQSMAAACVFTVPMVVNAVFTLNADGTFRRNVSGSSKIVIASTKYLYHLSAGQDVSITCGIDVAGTIYGFASGAYKLKLGGAISVKSTGDLHTQDTTTGFGLELSSGCSVVVDASGGVSAQFGSITAKTGSTLTIPVGAHLYVYNGGSFLQEDGAVVTISGVRRYTAGDLTAAQTAALATVTYPTNATVLDVASGGAAAWGPGGTGHGPGTYKAPVISDVKRPADGGTAYGPSSGTSGTLNTAAIASAAAAGQLTTDQGEVNTHLAWILATKVVLTGATAGSLPPAANPVLGCSFIKGAVA